MEYKILLMHPNICTAKRMFYQTDNGKYIHPDKEVCSAISIVTPFALVSLTAGVVYVKSSHHKSTGGKPGTLPKHG